MNFDSKKSIKDFKGHAMSADQQKAIKGGNNTQDLPDDFIIMDDILDG